MPAIKRYRIVADSEKTEHCQDIHTTYTQAQSIFRPDEVRKATILRTEQLGDILYEQELVRREEIVTPRGIVRNIKFGRATAKTQKITIRYAVSENEELNKEIERLVEEHINQKT